MAEAKYKWLKLQSNFFSQKEIKRLRQVAGGETFTIIYLKMQLLSLKNDGIIVFENVCDNFEEELALELDESVENVQMTLAFLKKTSLIEELSSDNYLLPEAVRNMGKECESAERVRRFRNNQNSLPDGSQSLQCNGNVTDGNGGVTQSKSKSKNKDIMSDAETATDNPPPDTVIKIILNNGKYHSVTSADVKRWQELYPAVDIISELRKIAGWNDSNPKHRKTKSGINKHINSWLAREQDRGRASASYSNPNGRGVPVIDGEADDVMNTLYGGRRQG